MYLGSPTSQGWKTGRSCQWNASASCSWYHSLSLSKSPFCSCDSRAEIARFCHYFTISAECTLVFSFAATWILQLLACCLSMSLLALLMPPMSRKQSRLRPSRTGALFPSSKLGSSPQKNKLAIKVVNLVVCFVFCNMFVCCTD